MILERIQAGIYAANCYLIGCEKTKLATIIDPGGDVDSILQLLEKHGLQLHSIILTHGHGDHIGGVDGLKMETDAKVHVHTLDGPMVKDAAMNLSNMMSGPDITFYPDVLLKDGQTLQVGKLELKVIHTPGHTRGGICIRVDDHLFTGDTLFKGSIGRTDFEGGSFEQIVNSIKTKLLTMSDGIHVYPGHGPASTIGTERRTNSYIR